jgi:hypothetical protein
MKVSDEMYALCFVSRMVNPGVCCVEAWMDHSATLDAMADNRISRIQGYPIIEWEHRASSR